MWSLVHVAGCEPYKLHDLTRVSRVGFVLYLDISYGSCAASLLILYRKKYAGSAVDYLDGVDRDLSEF